MLEKKIEVVQVEDYQFSRDLSARQREWREARLKAIRKLEEYIEYAHRPKHEENDEED